MALNLGGSNLLKSANKTIIEERIDKEITISGGSWHIADTGFEVTDDLKYYLEKVKIATADISCACSVEIEDGAIIKEIIVKGNAAIATKNWYLLEILKSDPTTTSTIATALFNTSVKVDYIVDNSKYYYAFTSAAFELAVNDEIWFSNIKYNIDYNKKKGKEQGGFGGGGSAEGGPGGA